MENFKNIKVNKKLVTMNTVLRGSWLIKISIFNGQILFIGFNVNNPDLIEIRTFWDSQDVYTFIEFLLQRT
jgi:hypothetical protein